jgi:hypothetical protein
LTGRCIWMEVSPHNCSTIILAPELPDFVCVALAGCSLGLEPRSKVPLALRHKLDYADLVEVEGEQ